MLLLSFFSPFTVIHGILSEEQGMLDQKSGMTHTNIVELSEYLEKNNFSEKDTLISANSYIFTYYYNYSFINNTVEWPLKRFDYFGDKMYHDYGTLYHYYYKAANLQNPAVSYVHKGKDYVCELDENERINRIILKYETGWIIIDKNRNRYLNERGFPLENFIVGDRIVEYTGNTSGYRSFDIYRWKIKHNKYYQRNH
ncbi:MAG: hypothetical protein K8R25_10680 [Methanosarcinales archaeon]|nr:hypothetical protein [Methanosarcinales archaeon]